MCLFAVGGRRASGRVGVLTFEGVESAKKAHKYCKNVVCVNFNVKCRAGIIKSAILPAGLNCMERHQMWRF